MINGHIYEFDGRKEFPINHGTVEAILKENSTIDEWRESSKHSCTNPVENSAESSLLLAASVKVVLEHFMKHDPEEVRFTFLALCSKSE